MDTECQKERYSLTLVNGPSDKQARWFSAIGLQMLIQGRLAAYIGDLVPGKHSITKA